MDPIEAGIGRGQLRLCPDGVSWLAINARPGESLEYRFRSEKDEQLIGRVYAARETMYVLTETMNVDAAGGISGRRIYPVGGTVLIKLKGVGGDEILTDIARGDESTDVHQVSGNIFRWTVPVTKDGLEPAERTPYAHGRVEIIDAQSDSLMAVGFTNADGAYELDYAASTTQNLQFVVRAEVNAPHAHIRVGPLLDDDLSWALTLADFEPGEQISDTLEIQENDTISGAFNIASVAGDGLRQLDPILPEAPPISTPLLYRWKPNAISGCGTCFIPGESPLIELSGSESDPDEWDKSVILHELCHYVLARFSQDDSPGTRHNGTRIEPVIAWSEGFATFCASVLMDDPVQLDYRLTGVRQVDIEVMDSDVSFGTSNDEQDGRVSEYLVAALLWDLADGGEGDDDDVEVDLTQLMNPILKGFKGSNNDLGAPGIDLVDYLTELACNGLDDEVDVVSKAREFLRSRLRCANGKQSLVARRQPLQVSMNPLVSPWLHVHKPQSEIPRLSTT